MIEWAVLYSDRLEFYSPLSKAPTHVVALADVMFAAPPRPADAAAIPFCGHYFLEVRHGALAFRFFLCCRLLLEWCRCLATSYRATLGWHVLSLLSC